ncbi:hypothetical protein G8A07_08300 [Roseateles sp. DAIF2]|uniref:YggT family protein n=1 Tax=Roseateles sp. DAIF2 TaxID=2714952 RepID=UPI0018A300E2|nr:YggT family protein [Roseateles sp. DAIF2]QPF72929.1 hypothetical protein G8A07_08300 [Roseateles sp. DAIF2]
MLWLSSSLKLLAEIALLALAGQWLLGLMIGARREHNVFYRLLQVLTGPLLRLTRRLSPRVVLDRHVPLAAFALLLVCWLAATLAKVSLCLQIGVQQCR